MRLAKGRTTQGDIRLDRRRDTIINRIVTTGSLVQRRIGGDRKGEIATKNSLGSAKIAVASIIAPATGAPAGDMARPFAFAAFAGDWR
jgi:hypothetical protein